MENQKMLNSLSIFLLAYNEEENIEKAVFTAFSVAKYMAKKFEIIVVLYEGSTDKTGEIVRNLSRELGNIRLVIQGKDMKGYGNALRIGIESSKNEYIFYTDADNQFDLFELKKFLPFIKEYDMIAGYRIQRAEGFVRLFMAWGYNILAKMLFKVNYKDMDCAFKLFKKSMFDKVKLTSSKGFVDPELFIKAEHYHLKIKQLGVQHYKRFEGRALFQANKWGMIKFSVIKDLVKEMLELKEEMKTLK